MSNAPHRARPAHLLVWDYCHRRSRCVRTLHDCTAELNFLFRVGTFVLIILPMLLDARRRVFPAIVSLYVAIGVSPGTRFTLIYAPVTFTDLTYSGSRHRLVIHDGRHRGPSPHVL